MCGQVRSGTPGRQLHSNVQAQTAALLASRPPQAHILHRTHGHVTAACGIMRPPIRGVPSSARSCLAWSLLCMLLCCVLTCPGRSSRQHPLYTSRAADTLCRVRTRHLASRLGARTQEAYSRLSLSHPQSLSVSLPPSLSISLSISFSISHRAASGASPCLAPPPRLASRLRAS